MKKSARELLQAYLPDLRLARYGRVLDDTTDFMSIGYADVIELGGKHYVVLKDEAERRFGLEDPKFWVKRCRELESGKNCILKLVFHETFPQKLGPLEILLYRSEDKEARILDLVRGDERFMQGFSVRDAAGNLVRVLDIVSGRRLDLSVEAIESGHEAYFQEIFPGILENFIGACKAIRFLHQNGEKHADIRRDHLYEDYRTGAYRWIDFDYTYDFQENPFGLDMFGLGNILIFLVGKGSWTPQEIAEHHLGAKLCGDLCAADFSLIFKNRLVNLRKLFPYVPFELNQVLAHFSCESTVFYDNVDEFLADLEPCLAALKSA